jgi:predicted ATPase
MQIPLTIDGILMRNPNAQKPKQLSKRSFYLSQLGLVVPSIQAVRDFLINMSFYDLLPSTLRNPQQSSLPLPLWEDGGNLGSTLKEIQRKKKDYLITEALEVVVPAMAGYSVIPVDQHLVTKLHYAFQNGGQKKVQSALSNEANGSIRMLGTLAALYQERFPSPLVIEEPEKEIYPDALAVCSDVLQEAALSYQVLVTTHSPDLIIYLPVDSLRVVEKEPNTGITKVGPLSEHQHEAIAENIFSPGALMRIQGLERKREESCYAVHYSNC